MIVFTSIINRKILAFVFLFLASSIAHATCECDSGVINILSCGAEEGDLSFSNTAAINAALSVAADHSTSCSTVFIPAGEFYISSSIVLPDNVTVKGEDCIKSATGYPLVESCPSMVIHNDPHDTDSEVEPIAGRYGQPFFMGTLSSKHGAGIFEERSDQIISGGVVSDWSNNNYTVTLTLPAEKTDDFPGAGEAMFSPGDLIGLTVGEMYLKSQLVCDGENVFCDVVCKTDPLTYNCRTLSGLDVDLGSYTTTFCDESDPEYSTCLLQNNIKSQEFRRLNSRFPMQELNKVKAVSTDAEGRTVLSLYYAPYEVAYSRVWRVNRNPNRVSEECVGVPKGSTQAHPNCERRLEFHNNIGAENITLINLTLRQTFPAISPVPSPKKRLWYPISMQGCLNCTLSNMILDGTSVIGTTLTGRSKLQNIRAYVRTRGFDLSYGTDLIADHIEVNFISEPNLTTYFNDGGGHFGVMFNEGSHDVDMHNVTFKTVDLSSQPAYATYVPGWDEPGRLINANDSRRGNFKNIQFLLDDSTYGVDLRDPTDITNALQTFFVHEFQDDDNEYVNDPAIDSGWHRFDGIDANMIGAKSWLTVDLENLPNDSSDNAHFEQRSSLYFNCLNFQGDAQALYGVETYGALGMTYQNNILGDGTSLFSWEFGNPLNTREGYFYNNYQWHKYDFKDGSGNELTVVNNQAVQTQTANYCDNTPSSSNGTSGLQCDTSDICNSNICLPVGTALPLTHPLCSVVTGVNEVIEDIDTDGRNPPDSLDSDDDNDGVEDALDAFPLNAQESVDSDGDGIGDNADWDDDNNGLDDADSDGLPDQWENQYSYCNSDFTATSNSDGDWLGDAAEFAWGTNPCEADTDHDGAPDWDEVSTGASQRIPSVDATDPNVDPQTSPLNEMDYNDHDLDTNENIIADQWELDYSDCNAEFTQTSNSDSDALYDFNEYVWMTNPCDDDTDLDGYDDYCEVVNGTLPTDINDHPAPPPVQVCQ